MWPLFIVIQKNTHHEKIDRIGQKMILSDDDVVVSLAQGAEGRTTTCRSNIRERAANPPGCLQKSLVANVSSQRRRQMASFSTAYKKTKQSSLLAREPVCPYRDDHGAAGGINVAQEAAVAITKTPSSSSFSCASTCANPIKLIQESREESFADR